MPSGSQSHKMDSAPFPPLAENPLQFTNSIQWPWIQGGSGIKPSWSGDSNTVTRTYSHFLLALLAFYWIHSSVRMHVCEGEGVHGHAVSHADLLDLRVGGGPIHTTWIERAGELRVLFLRKGKGWMLSWEKQSFSFYASLEFSISLPSSLRRAEEPLNLLHQQKPWNDTSQCRPYWGEHGIFVHRWGHH